MLNYHGSKKRLANITKMGTYVGVPARKIN